MWELRDPGLQKSESKKQGSRSANNERDFLISAAANPFNKSMRSRDSREECFMYF
jgi:hypothetical protein